MHKNSKWLLDWAYRMHSKTDGFDFCRKLAYFMGEAGNDHPSDAAIEEAKLWESAVDDGLDLMDVWPGE